MQSCSRAFASSLHFSPVRLPSPARRQKKATIAPPGDTLTTPGPLAHNLSPNLDTATSPKP